MKTRTLRTTDDLKKAGQDLMKLAGHLPMVMTISAGTKIRSEAQNSRYWVSLTHELERITLIIDEVAERTGFTNLTVRKIIAGNMEWEYSLILSARNPKMAHEVLKMILDIPTTTKAGTKEFMKFEDVMLQTMTEIVGEVQAYASKAAA